MFRGDTRDRPSSYDLCPCPFLASSSSHICFSYLNFSSPARPPLPLSHLATLRSRRDLRQNGTDHGPTMYQALFYMLIYCYNLYPLPYLIDAENESEREEGLYRRTRARKQQASLTLGKPIFFFPWHWAGCSVASHSHTQTVPAFRTFTSVCFNLCPCVSDGMYMISIISRISFV